MITLIHKQIIAMTGYYACDAFIPYDAIAFLRTIADKKYKALLKSGLVVFGFS